MTCPNCSNESSASHRYCRECKNEYMREWRKSHGMTENQKKQSRATSMVRAYVKRYKIKPLPCAVCGTTERLEAHHENYDHPLSVIWLCHEDHVKVTRKVLSVAHIQPMRIVNPDWITYLCEILRIDYMTCWRKVSVYIEAKEREWIAGGRKGMFKSYPIETKALIPL